MACFEVAFLGTSACDFSAKLQTEYKDSFDMDARRASCVLVDGMYLIDCGIHCLDQFRISRRDMAKVTDLFVTHLHSDHFNAENVAAIAAAKEEPLRVWLRADADIPHIPNTHIMRMDDLTTYAVNADLRVTGLRANHEQESFPQHILLEKAGRKIFYGCDGAWLLNSTYNYLKESFLSLMILDATCGDYAGDYRIAEHNSIPMIRLMLPSFKTAGIIDSKTEIYLSHIAPSLHKPHACTVEIVKKDGLKVAFDGLNISI